MKLVSIAAVLVALSSQVFAANGESGGGGKAALCTDSTTGKKIYRFMDYLRAEGPEWGHMTIVPGQGADEYEMAKDIASRLYDYAPNMRAKFVEAIENFRTNQVIYEDHNFFMVDDSHEDALPKNCTGPFMVVKQKSPENKQEKLYRINGEIWNSPLFSKQDKAGLIIHEVVLHDIRPWNQNRGSDRASFFTAYISSTLMQNHKDQDFYQLIFNTGLKYLSKEIFGREIVPIRLHAEDATTPNQELVVFAHRGYTTYFRYDELEFGTEYNQPLPPTNVKIAGHPVVLEGIGKISFNSDTKKIQRVSFQLPPKAGSPEEEFQRTVLIQGKPVLITLKGRELTYDSKGHVARATVAKLDTFFDGSGRLFPVPANQEVFFLEGKLLHIGLVRKVNAGKGISNTVSFECENESNNNSIKKIQLKVGYDKDENLYSALLKRTNYDSKEWVSFSSPNKPLFEEFEGPTEKEIFKASFDDLVKSRMDIRWADKCVLSVPVPYAVFFFWFWTSTCVIDVPVPYRPETVYSDVEAGDLVIKASRMPSPKDKLPFTLDINHRSYNRHGTFSWNGSFAGKFSCKKN